MFKDVDQKLQSFAKWYFGIQVAISVISAIVTICIEGEFWWEAILIAFAYSFCALFSSWLIFAVGKHLENQEIMIQKINDLSKKAQQRVVINKRQPVAAGGEQRNASEQQEEQVKATNNHQQSFTEPAQRSGPVQHVWKCRHCGSMISSEPCSFCGQ